MNRNRIIGFASGKGGVGKTTLCVNTAVSLSEMGHDVTVVDADFGASNLATYLGKYDHPVNIQDVLHGHEEADAAVFHHPSGVRAMTASNEIDKVEPDTSQMRDVLEHVAADSDYVMVDFPPGLHSTVESLMGAVDEMLVVTEPTQTAGVNAVQVVEKAMDLKKPVLGTVINKFEDKPDRELIGKEVEVMTKTNVLGKVPHDQTVKESQFENRPVIHHDPVSEASIEIRRLAAGLDGKRYEEPRFAPLKRTLNRVKRKIKK